MNAVILLLCLFNIVLGSPLGKLDQLRLKARYSSGQSIHKLFLAVDTKLGKIVVSNTLNSTTETNIYDLKDRLWYKINGHFCTVFDLEERPNGDPYFPFDINETNASKLIEDLFYMSDAVKGEGTIKKTDTYTKTGVKIINEDGTAIEGCNVSLMFSQNGIPSYWCQEEDGKCGPEPLYSKISCPNTTIRYQLFDFSDHVPEKVFQRKELTFCDGDRVKSVEVPTLAPFGRFVSLQNILDDEPITEVRVVWYDRNYNVYREDSDLDGKDPIPVTRGHIYDYNTRRTYLLTRFPPSCSVEEMDGNDQMPSLEKLALGFDPKDFIFQEIGKGFEKCRLSNCALIVGRENTTNPDKKVISLYYDPRHGFSDTVGRRIWEPNPILVKSIAREGHLEDGVILRDIHNYEVANDDWTLFDITTCKQQDQVHRMSMQLTGTEEIHFRLKGIEDEFRRHLTEFLGLKQPLRINRIQVTPEGDKLDILFVLLEPEDTTDPDKSTDQIVTELTKAVEDGTFQLTHAYLIHPQDRRDDTQANSTILTATKFSQNGGENDGSSSFLPEDLTDSTKITSAIGSFLNNPTLPLRQLGNRLGRPFDFLPRQANRYGQQV